jgi:hypothetical protein
VAALRHSTTWKAAVVAVVVVVVVAYSDLEGDMRRWGELAAGRQDTQHQHSVDLI